MAPFGITEPPEFQGNYILGKCTTMLGETNETLDVMQNKSASNGITFKLTKYQSYEGRNPW